MERVMVNKDMAVLLEHIDTLSLGINPFTKKEFAKNSKMHSPEIIRSLISVKNELIVDYDRKCSKEQTKKKVGISSNLPMRHGLKWTEDETIQVIDAFQTDIHPKDIARIHKRKVTAIIAKLESKGLIHPDERESYL